MPIVPAPAAFVRVVARMSGCLVPARGRGQLRATSVAVIARRP